MGHGPVVQMAGCFSFYNAAALAITHQNMFVTHCVPVHCFRKDTLGITAVVSLLHCGTFMTGAHVGCISKTSPSVVCRQSKDLSC